MFLQTYMLHQIWQCLQRTLQVRPVGRRGHPVSGRNVPSWICKLKERPVFEGINIRTLPCIREYLVEIETLSCIKCTTPNVRLQQVHAIKVEAINSTCDGPWLAPCSDNFKAIDRQFFPKGVSYDLFSCKPTFLSSLEPE